MPAFALCALSLAACAASEPTNEMPIQDERPAVAERFFPEELEQDGRISFTPVFSKDGRTMYFSQSECGQIANCPQRIKVSRMTEAGWSAPERVAQIPGARSGHPSLSPDGSMLLFNWSARRARWDENDVREDFDLYRLDLGDPDARPVPIDEPDINRIRGGRYKTWRYFNNEAAPILTNAGNLYFWSERIDGAGERDGYVAMADGAGGYEAPQLLSVNTPEREDSFWVNADETILLFASPDRGGEGQSDIFVSKRQADGSWGEAVNLGPIVNSSANEFFPSISPDGKRFFFTSMRGFDGQREGLSQIWSIPVSAVPALR